MPPIPPPPPPPGSSSGGEYYPPVGFYYQVLLHGDKAASDVRFSEASGLSAELSVEEYTEGGENRFRHHLPSAAKYTNLVLKRGLLVPTQPLFTWCKQTIQGNFAEPISLKSMQVVLLNPEAKPLKQWNLVNAYPVKWSVSDFKSKEGEVVIETMEIAYQYFEVS